MANWIPANLSAAMRMHLRNAVDVHLVLHFAEQCIRYGKKWDWTSQGKLEEISGVGKRWTFARLSGLVLRSILNWQKEGRRTYYQINQNYNTWGSRREEKSGKIFNLIGAQSCTDRCTIVHQIGALECTYQRMLNGFKASEKLENSIGALETLIDIYNIDIYNPSGTDLDIPLKSLQSWPTPLKKNPEELDAYLAENTKSWPVSYGLVLNVVRGKNKLRYLHPNDVLSVVVHANRVDLRSRKQYFGYCVNGLIAAYNQRMKAVRLEIHDMRKKGEL